MHHLQVARVPFVPERWPQHIEHAQQRFVLGQYPPVCKVLVEQVDDVVQAVVEEPSVFFKLTSSAKVIVIVAPVLFTPDAPSAGETEETEET